MAYTTIDDPSVYFQALLYTGDGNASQAQTNTGNSDLQPDWIWIKKRNSARNTTNTDSSRGFNKRLETQTNSAETTTTNDVISAQSDGFTVGDNGSTGNNSDTYVAWQWKANVVTTSTNSSCSSNSTVQANTTAGFSIVKRTGTGSAGATYGHGLGAVPDVIINKGLNSNEWYSYFKAIGGGTHWIDLSGTGAKVDDANMWNDTDATSTLFTVGNSGGSNGSSVEYIAYCFTSIQGYSKFGSYTANNSTDGPFVYLGFKPAWIMVKNTSAAADWPITDNKREVGNPFGEEMLFANGSDAETSYSGGGIDFVSNGFKIRSSGTNGVHNANNTSHTFIYMAFAESPFVSSEGVPTTAR